MMDDGDDIDGDDAFRLGQQPARIFVGPDENLMEVVEMSLMTKMMATNKDFCCA